jgi:hypothetical protein
MDPGRPAERIPPRRMTVADNDSNPAGAMSVKMEGEYLVVRIRANKKPKPSKSGNSLLVASTGGNAKTGLMVGNKEVIIGLNAYIPAD